MLTSSYSQDAQLEIGLRERLPRSYNIYLEIVSEIAPVMGSLKKELSVVERGNMTSAEVRECTFTLFQCSFVVIPHPEA